MFKTAKDLKSIDFPVYALYDDNWYVADGVLFLDGQVIDDSNMPGKTLGIRRLQCGRSDLLKLRRAFLDAKAMLGSGKKHFVDSSGVPFTYIKTQRCKLIHHRVLDIKKSDSYSLVTLESKEMPLKLKIPRPPLIDPIWARVLYYGPTPWLIYDFKVNRCRDSFRRV